MCVSTHTYAYSTSCGITAILADTADEKECVIQLSFSLFCPNTDLCGHNSFFVAERRALNSGSRQKGTCWKGGDVKWQRSKGPWSIMLEWCCCRGMFLLFLYCSALFYLSLFSVLAALIYYMLFLWNCPLFFFCSINIPISFVLFWCWMTELKKRNLSLLSHLISWWSHCCFACWTGAWLFPWVCYWNRSPCLWWRTAHPIRPRCWTTSTGWVVSLATKSCSYQQTCFPISSETYNVVARRHINFSFDTSTPPILPNGLATLIRLTSTMTSSLCLI